MQELDGISNQVLDGLKWIIIKINELLVYIAGAISTSFNIPSSNLYLILLAISSIYLSFLINKEGFENNWLKKMIIAIIIFAVFYVNLGK